MKALRIPKEEAEMVRKRLLSLGVFDSSRKIIQNGEFIELPITNTTEYDVIEQDQPIMRNTKATLIQLLANVLSREELVKMPHGWQIIGDIIIVNIPTALQKRKYEIGGALLELHPRCKTALMIKGVTGQYREPDVEIIAGEDTQTIHKENGCLFKLDASKIMFSKGNLEERRRLSRFGQGIVVDMFAGIGYFSIPMAVHSNPEKVLAIEVNPLAYNYLCENIALNGVEGIVQPIYGDCLSVTPVGVANRVIMGSFEAFHYLTQGINALKSGGILHYHETTPEKLVFERPVRRVVESAEKLGRSAEVIGLNKIKKYSPGVWHVVVDAQVF
ncbi:MAG: class I SAM-dependent methyltransferase family protein [Methanocellales archaeon]|nr:class I SAM-dependent methyltransferase family protein [Methanocellales archaeon]MDD3290938.1 class I SAM-dependent methyltransferase family protein [Methanocellales archaeon]MDD3292318.1 class I SAM-dependent methyltransferase family protein [Methanocellales archaeon]MDD5234823.1 class I SAM-dependent methyltransferase family protein [Methanocellales archaeon]MDD5484807.1 class I SAM-dependent methyltransferase family protein [Methanocellales archaeon]